MGTTSYLDDWSDNVIDSGCRSFQEFLLLLTVLHSVCPYPPARPKPGPAYLGSVRATQLCASSHRITAVLGSTTQRIPVDMSLSTGTRNLKFMQRAAARNSLNASTSAAGSGSNTPQRSATPSAGTPGASTRTPARANNAFGAIEGVRDDGVSTPSGSTSRSGPQVDSEGVLLSNEEKAAMWVLPARPARPTSLASAGRDVEESQAGPSSGRRFVFERSYMPFMIDTSAAQTDESEEEDDQDAATHNTYIDNTSHTANAANGSTSTTAGGGRMTFGNFGQAAKDAETPAGDAYGSDEDDAETSTRKLHGRAGYMQNDAQGARGKKRGSDTQGDYRGQSNGYERDRDESRQAKIRKMAQDRARQQPVRSACV